jgi:multidrug efflux pump subunit AcrA (membrane-fusion protein)
MPESTNNIPSQPETNGNLSALDVRSEEVQEIIGRPPHWLVRWGVTAFFGVLGLVLLSAAVIKYPEVIDAPLRLTAVNAPQSLESRISGKLVRIIVENNTHVYQGDVLAWLESTARHGEVLRLSETVDTMRGWLLEGSPQRLTELDIEQFANLGEIQNAFQTFEQAYREFVSFLPGGFYLRQREILMKELEYTRDLLAQLHSQKEIQQDEYNLGRREVEIQQRLAEDGHIAPIELARAEAELSARQLPLQQTESAIINNFVSQIAKEREIMELDKRLEEQSSMFLQSLNSLRSVIDDWKTSYLVTAPYDGKVVYAGILQENQSLTAGQPLFYIQPDNTSFFGELAVSQASFGKIKEGQPVQVRFSGYPYHEFGSVFGRVEYFSDFPVRDSLFFARVSFPDDLVTNYGREITPRNGMTGQAEIITQDIRLLERVYNNITSQIR